MKITRRQFMKGAAATGIGMALPLKFGVRSAHAFAQSPTLAKWVWPIRGLGASGIPVMSSVPDPVFSNTNYYQITIGEFTDQLHPNLGTTRLWGYWDGAVTSPVKAHLGGVILARRGTPSRIRFTNTLPAMHIIPVDLSIPQPASQQQNRTATHLHGGLVPWISDGGPHDWFTPGGPGYATGLSFPNGPGGFLDNLYPAGQKMAAGQADYYYPNDQSFRLAWYHDHAWGITRINAYAGIASAYLIQDSINDAYVAAGKIPALASTIPLVWQDKIFVDPATTFATDPTWATVARGDVQTLGSLWYAHVYDPKLYKLSNKKNLPAPPNPSVVPEFFGDTMLCNGTVYPYLQLEAKRYRFLMLNACNARFLNINLLQVAAGAEVVTDKKTLFANLAVNPQGPPMIQIGTEGGFLVTEVSHLNGVAFNPLTLTGNLLLAPAERADVIIDFTGCNGQEFIMYNDAPGPFPVGAPTNDYWLGNNKNPTQPLPGTGPDTRQILRIKVVAAVTPDPQPAGAILNPALVDPPLLSPVTNTTPPIAALPDPAASVGRRFLTLNEDFDGNGRLRQLLGTNVINPLTGNYGREYMTQPPTEVAVKGTTEVWVIYNLTADTHPIHFHLVNVQVLWRQPFVLTKGVFTLTPGAQRGPEPDELGWKETVKMNPGEATAVAMKFDLPAVPFTVPFSTRLTTAAGAVIPNVNEYVWHCHILEHEEHDMMRPLAVTGANPKATMAIAPATLTIASFAAGAGKTFTFIASNGIKPLTLTVNDANFPAVLTTNGSGFAVTLPLISPVAFPYTATYTLSDSSNPAQQASASLTISAA